MILRDQMFEARWLFLDLGWVILRAVPNNAAPNFLIRGTTVSGTMDARFDWGIYPTLEAAKLEIALLTPLQVYEKAKTLALQTLQAKGA